MKRTKQEKAVSFRLQRTACLVILPLVLSCKPAVEGEDEYVPHPDPVGGRWPSFCQWDEPPSGPEGVSPHPISVRVPLGERTGCTEISAEEADRALFEAIEEECDQPVEQFLRGCYLLFESRGECSFGAYYFSACEVDDVVE